MKFKVGDRVAHGFYIGEVVGFEDGKAVVFYEDASEIEIYDEWELRLLGNDKLIQSKSQDLGVGVKVGLSKMPRFTELMDSREISKKTNAGRAEIKEYVVESVIKQNKIKNGGIKMNLKKMFGEFGKVANNEVAMTFDGKVVFKRSNGEFVRFNVEKEQIENHMEFVMEQASKFIYIMPVTTVEVGDVIKYNKDFYQILQVKDNGSIHGVNLSKGTKSTICKETNAFGFNFYYKVTSLMGQVENNAQAGGFNPMMLMLMGEDKGNMEDLLPLMMMSGGMGNAQAGGINPMMLMMMGEGKDSSMKDLMLMQMLSGGMASGEAMNPMMMMMLMGDK